MTNDEKLDMLLEFIGIELFEWQKMYLRELVNDKRPITCIMPKQVGYLQAMMEAENYKNGFYSAILFDEQHSKGD